MRKVLLILLTFILLLVPIQVGCSNRVSKLSIPTLEHGYSNFESTFIVNQSDLDDFISDI